MCFFGTRKQNLPVRPSSQSSDEAEGEIERPIPVETVSTKKLAICPQIWARVLIQPSRDPNSATHPNTSSAGESGVFGLYGGIEATILLAVKNFLNKSVR